jgi:hypothetical protein
MASNFCFQYRGIIGGNVFENVPCPFGILSKNDIKEEISAVFLESEQCAGVEFYLRGRDGSVVALIEADGVAKVRTDVHLKIKKFDRRILIFDTIGNIVVDYAWGNPADGYDFILSMKTYLPSGQMLALHPDRIATDENATGGIHRLTMGTSRNARFNCGIYVGAIGVNAPPAIFGIRHHFELSEVRFLEHACGIVVDESFVGSASDLVDRKGNADS